ncbi:hypothetical protein EST38_g2151 [Candolleomyces aberdarensis]|uniref:Uncharacterized protein n=1 Tax=Candolleomyces aberdarensis TaxID=2316362 RepID=A0A4Q2DU64_9AGAR|nr:hypothetical protein EST38_g2151 [Candolleomyces aberdarensis]
MANAKITDLAFELLHQIMLLVPHREPTAYSLTPLSSLGREWGYPLQEDSDQLHKLARLRSTCRAFDAAIQPILFSELTLDCLYTRLDIVDHQISCFEDNVNGPWNHCTRKLRIVNLDPCYDKKPSGGGVQYWEEYLNQEQRDQAGEMKTMIQERLLPSLHDGLPNLESLRWFVRVGDPVEQLVAHFSQLPSLTSLELVFWSDKVFPYFPLDAFSNLTRIDLFFFHDEEDVRIDDVWVVNARELFRRLDKVVKASPSLTSLKLARRSRYDASQDGRVLFPGEFLLSPSSRNLRHLTLHRFDLTNSYPKVLHNLTSLTSVDLTECSYETETVFWHALLKSDVLLTSIRLDYVDDNLIAYISQPKVPLESLTLLLERFQLCGDLDWEENKNLARKMYTTVLEVHSGTLKHLDIETPGQKFWWLECLKPLAPTPRTPGAAPASDSAPPGPDPDERFEPNDAPVLLEETSLFQCQRLRSLGLVIDFQRALMAHKLGLVPGAIEERVTAFLKHMVARMPLLDTVTIYAPDRLGHRAMSRSIRASIHEAIQDFSVTEKDRINVQFDVIFEESRYELRRDIFDGIKCADDEGEDSSLQWRFVDINAESDEEEEEEEKDGEGSDEEDREAFSEQVRNELPDIFS